MMSRLRYFFILFVLFISCKAEVPSSSSDLDTLPLENILNEDSLSQYINEGSWDKAYVLQREKTVRSKRKELVDYLCLGEILEQKQSFLEVDSLLQIVDSIFHKDTVSPQLKIKWLNLEARVNRELNHYYLANELTKEAIDVNPLENVNDSILWFESRVDYAKSFYRTGEYQKALKVLQESDSLVNELTFNSPVLEFRLLTELATLNQYFRDFTQNEFFLKRADSLLRKNLFRDFRKRGTILMALGSLEYFRGNLLLADDYFTDVEGLYRQHSFPISKVAILYFNKALVHASKGNPQNAIIYYEKSLRIYQNIDTVKYANTINTLKHNLALQHLEINNIPTSNRLLTEIVHNYNRKHRKDYILASTYFNLGRLNFTSNQWNSVLAETYLDKSISLYDSIFKTGNGYVIQPLLYYSKLSLKQKKIIRSDSFITEAIGIADGKIPQDDYYWGKLLEQKALISAFKQEWDSATVSIRKALRFLPLEKDPKILYRLDILLSKSSILVDEIEHDYSINKAEEFLNHLGALKETFYLAKSQIINQEDKYGHLSDVNVSYRKGVEIGYQLASKKEFQNYKEKSWGYIELSKASILLENISTLQGFSKVGDSQLVFNQENLLSSRISYFKSALMKNARVEDKDKDKEDYKLEDSLVSYQAQYSELIDQIKINNPAYHSTRYGQNLISLGETQASLTPSETLLEYFRTDTALYAFGVNREDATFQKLPLPKDFDAELDAFLKSSQFAPQTDLDFKTYYAETAHKLYQILVKPLLDSLQAVPHEGKSQLIVVPDGKLGYLPFDVLLTEAPQDLHSYKSYPFLLKDFSIRSAYSATLMKVLEDKKVEEKEFLAAFAPSYIKKETLLSGIKGSGSESCEAPREEEFRELLQAGLELDKILQHVNGDRFDTLEASEEQFKAIADKYRILHLNMHGFTNDCDPMYSGLAFTPRTLLEQKGRGDRSNPTNEGILHAYEIYNMRINAELVVMSACQTGLGKIQAGEGIMSLARAFAHAGSPNTVMSLWQVDEAATRKLMDEFYKQLGEGKGKDEALQLAKLAYLHGHVEAHPFFWAGFVLIGDDKPIEENSWLLRYGWMGLLSMLLLLSMFWILRRNSMPTRN